MKFISSEYLGRMFLSYCLRKLYSLGPSKNLNISESQYIYIYILIEKEETSFITVYITQISTPSDLFID